MNRGYYVRSKFADKKAEDKKQKKIEKKQVEEVQQEKKIFDLLNVKNDETAEDDKTTQDNDNKTVQDNKIAKKAKEWTVEDNELVKKMFNEHKSFEEIGLVLKRTPLAISFRHQMYVNELINGGKTDNEVSTLLNLTEEKVDELYQKEKTRIEKNKKQDEERPLKRQLREQLKDEKKVVKQNNQNKQKSGTISIDNEIKEIEELTRVKKLMLENGMNIMAQELDIEIKEKIKNQVTKIKTVYASA
ncbi:MAG: hypothetical protein Terrestrivirus1_144 [Terrestrivirus sp.]|uniref:Uncharacterized protein n=1 Tax=Terrestrivirus sp. TaxID=2487775 RepID=A0A3G4ZKB1_9VIRU|nr:MAG: hypothetical protein Terrestrivirus1_144 [Terrestrivirus sp.]